MTARLTLCIRTARRLRAAPKRIKSGAGRRRTVSGVMLAWNKSLECRSSSAEISCFKLASIS